MDPDFLSEIDKCDIFGISETHIFDEILDELDIPGFKRIHYKNRKKFKKVNKTSGGIAIFAKNSIAEFLEPFKTTNSDIIWVKLKKKHHHLPKDIYIGSVYTSGENNTKSIGEKIKNLSHDIETIKGKHGEIIIQGDFNARTANINDFVEYDKYDTLSEIDCIEFFDIPPRCSEDKIHNNNGKELLV
jgi:exonuclease III